jgi:dipeptidyl aminopeptidase/acylaminoacyl peptidase
MLKVAVSALIFVSALRWQDKPKVLVLMPSFSPDAKQIVFVRIERKNDARPLKICVANVDGSSVCTITEGDFLWNPRFSPDGKSIVFSRAPARSRPQDSVPPADIWIVQSDGTGLRALTKTDDEENYPEFTSDGQSVVFLRSKKIPDPGSVIAVNLKDNTERTLVGPEYRTSYMSPGLGKGLHAICGQVHSDGKIDPVKEGIVEFIEGQAPKTRFSSPKLTLGTFRGCSNQPIKVFTAVDIEAFAFSLFVLDANQNPKKLATVHSRQFDLSGDGRKVIVEGIMKDDKPSGPMICDLESGAWNPWTPKD